MAERRMFARTIIDSDAFLDMPQSTQLLYFQLSMRADDDGFINNPKSIMRNVGCKDDDLKVLSAKKFIIPFESGVIVIKHWRIHNYIAKDRYHETKYKTEKAALSIDENGSYTTCIQPVHKVLTEARLGKVSLGEERKEDTCTSYSPDIPQDSPEDAHAPIPEPEPEEEQQEPGAYPKVVYAAWEALGAHVYQPASLWAFSQKWSVQVRPHLKGIHSKDVLQALENLKAIYDAPPGTYYWTQKIGVEAFFSKHLEKFLPANFNPDDFKKRLSFIEQQEAETRASYLQVFGHEMGEEA